MKVNQKGDAGITVHRESEAPGFRCFVLIPSKKGIIETRIPTSRQVFRLTFNSKWVGETD